MLSLQSLSTSTAQCLKYYSDPHELGQAEYYLDGSPCHWTGKGSESLGLSGEVTRRDFEAVLNGIHPLTGESLVGRGPGSVRRPGHDFVFSPPKSVSIAAILSRASCPVLSKLLVGIHQTAYGEALGYMESFCAFTRRGPGGAIRESSPNLVVACFDHIRARPTPRSHSGDIQLHTHCIVANLSPRSTDGSWGTLESKPFYLAQKQISRVYNASLRRQLHDLGIETVRTPNGGFEIAGIPDIVLREFSSRREQIERALEESGRSGAAAAEAATLKTRQAKPVQPIRPESEQRAWAMRAMSLGFDIADFGQRLLNNIAAHAAEQPMRDANKLRTTESVVAASRSAFTRDELDRLAARLSAKAKANSPLPAADEAKRGHAVAQELIDTGRVVPVGTTKNHDALYAHRRNARHLGKLEHYVKAHHESSRIRGFGVKASTLSKTISAESNPRTVEQEVSRIATSSRGGSLTRRQRQRQRRAAEKRSGIRLTDAQKATVGVLCERNRSRIRTLVGDSGTGKTVALRAAAAAYAAAGYRVIGIAKSGPAARELQSKAGIGDVMTLAQYRAHVGENWFVKLTREHKNLGRALAGKPAARRPKPFGRKTVVIVDGGHAFSANELRALLRDAKRSLVVVSGSLEDGRGTAFASLARHTRCAMLSDKLRGFGKASLPVPERVHAADPVRELIETWSAREAANPAGATIIAPAKRHAAELNQAAQRARIDRGHIDASRSAESKSGVRFHKGDRITFNRGSQTFRVKNGQTGEITRIIPAIIPLSRPTLVVRTDDDRTVFVPLSAFDSIDLGYATTRARADSVETDRAYVLDMPGSRLAQMCRWADKVTLFSAERDVLPSESIAKPIDQSLEHEGRGVCR